MQIYIQHPFQGLQQKNVIYLANDGLHKFGLASFCGSPAAFTFALVKVGLLPQDFLLLPQCHQAFVCIYS